MIKIDTNYDDYTDNTDPAYPGGKAYDTSTSDSEDGTSWKADLFNDLMGARQAIIVAAHGTFIISGLPDRVGASDLLDALKIVMSKVADHDVSPQFILSRLLTVDGVGSGLDAEFLGGHPLDYFQPRSSAGYFVKEISGPETVIPWTEINIAYSPEKVFCIFISAHGLYREFLNFSYQTKEDGLHVFPERLVDGKIVPGTRRKMWGVGKWGEGKIWVDGRKWGVGLWGSGPWDASRFVGGDAWGVYAPMPINIHVKEAGTW
jgi:hypothetical protein